MMMIFVDPLTCKFDIHTVNICRYWDHKLVSLGGNKPVHMNSVCDLRYNKFVYAATKVPA